ncbi:MAG: hypothetical protein SP4CHLAM5_10390 [Chlamydiia bacterium]|nr:hypothetical protein [Chlamydiia bacterium]MCH9618896.1 hypothetical protein [Chlamydiia bacterium]MCH9624563.1 hypothetical protein [Chlamydiia bacterium]
MGDELSIIPFKSLEDIKNIVDQSLVFGSPLNKENETTAKIVALVCNYFTGESASPNAINIKKEELANALRELAREQSNLGSLGELWINELDRLIPIFFDTDATDETASLVGRATV